MYPVLSHWVWSTSGEDRTLTLIPPWICLSEDDCVCVATLIMILLLAVLVKSEYYLTVPVCLKGWASTTRVTGPLFLGTGEAAERPVHVPFCLC